MSYDVISAVVDPKHCNTVRRSVSIEKWNVLKNKTHWMRVSWSGLWTFQATAVCVYIYIMSVCVLRIVVHLTSCEFWRYCNIKTNCRDSETQIKNKIGENSSEKILSKSETSELVLTLYHIHCVYLANPSSTDATQDQYKHLLHVA